MKTIKGNLELKKDTIFNESINVEGNIFGNFSLKVEGDLNCLDLNCKDLNCLNLNCLDLNCWDLNCWDLNCLNLNCKDLNFYAVAIAYHSFTCKSWNAGRDKYIIKCIDGEIAVEK